MIDWPVFISEVKRKSGLSGAELARKLDVRPQLISEIETGRSKNPGSDFLLKLIDRIGLNPAYLSGEGEMFRPSPFLKGPSVGLGVSKEAHEQVMSVARTLDPETPADVVGRIVRLERQVADRERLLAIKDSVPGEGAFVVPLLDQALSAGPGADLQEADTVVGYIEVPRALRRFGNNIAALSVSGDSMEPTLYDGDMVLCDKQGWDGDGVYAVRLDGHGLVKRLSKRPGAVLVISDNPKYSPFEARPEEIEVVGRARYGMRKM